jgi:hypothetical protein
LKILSEVSLAERSLRYNEPPFYPRPVAAAWADAAAKAGKRKEAEKAYRIALEEFPALDRAERGLRQLLSQGGKRGPKLADGGLE